MILHKGVCISYFIRSFWQDTARENKLLLQGNLDYFFLIIWNVNPLSSKTLYLKDGNMKMLPGFPHGIKQSTKWLNLNKSLNTKVLTVFWWFFLGGGEGHFSDDSDGKESAWNARDSGLIPESGQSPEEGNGNHSSILAWRIPWTEEPRPWGCKELDMTERLTLSLSKMGNAKKCSNYHTFALISHAALSPWHNSWWTNHMAHLMKKEELEMLGPHKNILCIHKTQIIKEEP